MSEPTHYLDIRIGVDYTELLSPERIEGVKVVLGLLNSEEIIPAHAQMIIDTVQNSLGGRIEISSMEAQVNETEKKEEQLIEFPEEPIQVAEESKVDDIQLDNRLTESIKQLEVRDPIQDESEDTFYLLEMMDKINEEKFEIQAMLGTVNKIKIRSNTFTAAEMALNLGIDENLISVGNKDLEVQYVIEYTDIENKIQEKLGEK